MSHSSPSVDRGRDECEGELINRELSKLGASYAILAFSEVRIGNGTRLLPGMITSFFVRATFLSPNNTVGGSIHHRQPVRLRLRRNNKFPVNEITKNIVSALGTSVVRCRW